MSYLLFPANDSGSIPWKSGVMDTPNTTVQNLSKYHNDPTRSFNAKSNNSIRVVLAASPDIIPTFLETYMIIAHSHFKFVLLKGYLQIC